MGKPIAKGILLEADKVYDFGGGPMSFTREALEKVATNYNVKPKNKGFERTSLVIEDDKLICIMEGVHVGCALDLESSVASGAIDLSELLK